MLRAKTGVYFSALVVLVLTIIFPANLSAQSFGFGDYEDSYSTPGLSVNISGDANAELKFFYDDFNSMEKMLPGNIFSGSLNFSSSGSMAEAMIKLNLVPDFDKPSSIISIDEAYLRTFFGPVNITAGLRKLTWGKADSLGPLDVINPLDYTDLSGLNDPQSIKIARPLLHLSWNITYTSRLEAVFVPWFQGHQFAGSGRWAPSQITSMPANMTTFLTILNPSLFPNRELILNKTEEWLASGSINNFFPDTGSIYYAQAGLRFTTSIGPADLGFQYYFGRLPRPTFNIDVNDFILSIPSDIKPSLIKIKIAYNPYHQIGIDYAQVIAGNNIRAEFGANITQDLAGTDGAVYNPALVWSLGFDRNLFWGINLNAQGSGSVRLMHNKLGSNPMEETEYNAKMTNTRLTLLLSKTFLRDELEIKAAGLWGIEDKDFLLMPGISWSRNSVSLKLSAGIFLGDKNGEMGQYRDNGYLKISMGYSF